MTKDSWSEVPNDKNKETPEQQQTKEIISEATVSLEATNIGEIMSGNFDVPKRSEYSEVKKSIDLLKTEMDNQEAEFNTKVQELKAAIFNLTSTEEKYS